MHKDIKEVLVDEKEIASICERLGAQITKDYTNKKPILIGLLKGCHPFMADLSKKIDLYLEIDYMDCSSYHGETTSSGDVKIIKDLEVSVKGRDVIIAEDIVDTGRTINTVVDLLKHREAASVEVVTLLDKPEGRVIDFVPKYIGKTIPNAFVIGYGLDYDEYYRNLPYVGIIKEEAIKK